MVGVGKRQFFLIKSCILYECMIKKIYKYVPNVHFLNDVNDKIHVNIEKGVGDWKVVKVLNCH